MIDASLGYVDIESVLLSPGNLMTLIIPASFITEEQQACSPAPLSTSGLRIVCVSSHVGLALSGLFNSICCFYHFWSRRTIPIELLQWILLFVSLRPYL